MDETLATTEQVQNPVADAFPEERALFIRRTYGHLAAALAAFVVLETILLNIPFVVDSIFKIIGIHWLLLLGGFMVLTWIARSLVEQESISTQYAGLSLYTVAEALIFVPILYIAKNFTSPEVLPMAALITSTLFVGLSVVAFTTRKDFSFLGGILSIGGIVAMGIIIAGSIWGFELGLIFSGGMVLLASGAILYDTSKVIHKYNSEQYVAAALSLFASVLLLFWYVLRILMRLRR